MTTKVSECKFCHKPIERDLDYYDGHPGFCNARCHDYFELRMILEAGSKDEGFLHERVKINEREAAFSKRWISQNKPCPGLNFGNGTLQDLFIEQQPNDLMNQNARIVLWIEPRDRFVAATVIQWLGSNVGQCFLETVLKDFGKKIVDIP